MTKLFTDTNVMLEFLRERITSSGYDSRGVSDEYQEKIVQFLKYAYPMYCSCVR
jgi:hypothetical protein